MDIQITQDDKKWYTATIKKLCINTQWDSRDDLLFNIKEALQCYYEAISKKKQHNFL
jgi:predicted RNase H-like HicB family nuclease